MTKRKKTGWPGDPVRHSFSSRRIQSTKSFAQNGAPALQRKGNAFDVLDQRIRALDDKVDNLDDKFSKIKTPTGTMMDQETLEMIDDTIPDYESAGTASIESMSGRLYEFPKFKTLDREKFPLDYKEYIASDEEFVYSDLPINSQFSVMDVFVDSAINKENILLVGPTGTGKTSLAQYWAYKRNQPFIRVPLSKITVDELLGHFEVVTDAQGNPSTKWVDGILTLGVKRGWVVLLDEINAAKPDVLFALHTLTDHDRKLYLLTKGGEEAEIKAHPESVFIAAMNQGEEYAGTNILNAAFLNRFTMIPVEYLSKKDELEVIKDRTNIKPWGTADQMKDYTPGELASAMALDILLDIAEYTRSLWKGTKQDKDLDQDEVIPISTRQLIRWSNDMDSYFKTTFGETPRKYKARNARVKLVGKKNKLGQREPFTVNGVQPKDIKGPEELEEFVLSTIQQSMSYAIEPYSSEDEDIATRLMTALNTAMRKAEKKQLAIDIRNNKKQVVANVLGKAKSQ